MSPVPPSLSSVSSSAVVSSAGVPHLPTIPSWYNPLPDNYRQLDDRKVYLQSSNRNLLFLEMHPNGTRGVSSRTDYCILTILLVRIMGFANENRTSKNLINWDSKHHQGRLYEEDSGSIHVIRSNITGKYLCMDDHSVIYQSSVFKERHCEFWHNYSRASYVDRYYRYRTNSTEKWFIGINNDGSIRCGNITRRQDKGAQFQRIGATDTEINKTATPFVQPKRKCCPGKVCRRRKGRGRKEKDRKRCKNKKRKGKGNTDKNKDCKTKQKKCRTRRNHKKWCKKHRRKFFRLNLKELRRYYKRCIKRNKVRHCKDS